MQRGTRSRCPREAVISRPGRWPTGGGATRPDGRSHKDLLASFTQGGELRVSRGLRSKPAPSGSETAGCERGVSLPAGVVDGSE